jgi:hypothetical protein
MRHRIADWLGYGYSLGLVVTLVLSVLAWTGAAPIASSVVYGCAITTAALAFTSYAVGFERRSRRMS